LPPNHATINLPQMPTVESSAIRADRFRTWLAALLILLAGSIAYHNSFDGAFVFDDQGAILENPTIRDLRALGDVLSPPTAGLPVTGRPITNLSLALNYAWQGTRPFGYHLVNLGLHLGAALALFGLLRRLLLLRPALASGAPLLAGATALLWVVHPLTTGAVTYISQRAESLASLLILLALYAHLRAAVAPRPWPWLALVVAATWLAVGSKEFGGLIPLLILCLERCTTRGSGWPRVRGRQVYLGLLFASWLPLVGFILQSDNRGGTWAAAAGYSPWEYLRLQAQFLPHYLRLVFWPAPLVFDYGRNLVPPDWWRVLPHALFLLALLGATVVAWSRRSLLALAGLVFFGVLAPTSSFIPIADPVFEHRMYLPAAAVLAVVMVFGYRLLRHRLLWLVPPVAALLASLTIARNADYISPLHLWGDTVAKRPDNARARGNYGRELMVAGRPGEALAEFQAAHALTPELSLAALNLATAYEQTGDDAAAATHYRRALELQPRNFLAQTALARLLARRDQLPEALELFEAAVEEVPEFVDARIGYGRALLRAGRTDEALTQFQTAVSLREADAELHFNLGDALAQAGRLPEAISAFSTAVRLQPHFTAAWHNLGNAQLLSGERSAAIASLERAVALEPTAATHVNLALAYLLERQRDEAEQHLNAALELEPEHPTARATLDRLRRLPALR
jgi:protein O-mannosyl-transferase